MRNKMTVGLSTLFIIVMSVICFGDVYADCGGAKTVLIDCKENENGICHVINLVVQIITVGIGTLVVLGISIMGIQYLTAGGNEERVRKSKRRLLELVIGLAVYVVAGAGIQWLLPGNNFCGIGGGGSGDVSDIEDDGDGDSNVSNDGYSRPQSDPKRN